MLRKLFDTALRAHGESLAAVACVSARVLSPLQATTTAVASSATCAVGPRALQTSAACSHQADVDPNAETISVRYIDRDGKSYDVQAPVGSNLLEVAHREDIDLEGACEGSLACSTCHVIVEDQAFFDRMPEADDDENDMLDLAFGLTETSRLGCQIIAAKDLDGLVVRIPDATRNFAVDGHRPKPH